MNVEKVNLEVKKDITEQFSTAFTEYRLKNAESTIKEASAGVDRLKVLTLDIFHESATTVSRENANKLIDIVETWTIDFEKSEIVNDVIAFCQSMQDINRALLCEKSDGEELVIIMDDSSNDAVLDYNEYCFNLQKKYKAITDFMVLDNATSKGIQYMYMKINVIYERG